MKILVEVLPEDIPEVRMFPSSVYCPLARAIQRSQSTPHAWVDTSAAHVKGSIYKLSPEALAFIAKYDSLEPVEPASFELDLLKEGAIK